ncbi:MAG: GNAT family N-acetyltransferase [Pseudohongiellaceae bacterium]
MITLRLAELADVSLLQHWDRQDHVIAASGDDDVWDWPLEIGRVVPWQEILIAEHQGRPVGVLQIIDPLNEESHYWGDCPANLRAIDIWIGEAEDLGKGYGSEMMIAALLRCVENPDVRAVLIDPLVTNRRAIRFYERLGFRFVEQRQLGEDDCCVYRIHRDEILARYLTSQ